MNIKLNGKHQSAPDGATVLALAESLGLNPKQVAIERNRGIVPRSVYGSVRLAEGDEIEVVKFIGGG
ncbi:MAG: sulfur carrier protein ThiS [Pseudomonadota bacterium]|nr:sulfur carrier protein ThiS [Pseudomonadota bacterium]MDE3037704.1 sulfur carrier protein ThiS [Pseudomonadota bacterium]